MITRQPHRPALGALSRLTQWPPGGFAAQERGEVFGQDDDASQQVAVFPDEHAPLQTVDDELPTVRARLSEMPLRRLRQWGGRLAGWAATSDWGWPVSVSESGPAGREVRRRTISLFGWVGLQYAGSSSGILIAFERDEIVPPLSINASWVVSASRVRWE